jgi:hypothetical protein
MLRVKGIGIKIILDFTYEAFYRLNNALHHNGSSYYIIKSKECGAEETFYS